MIVSDSSESENSESTQGTEKKCFLLFSAMFQILLLYIFLIYAGSGSNFMTPFEDCQSPTNQPVINTEGNDYNSDFLFQMLQYMFLN